MNDAAEVAVQRRRSPAEIKQIVAEFTQSDLGRTEFCRRHGLSLGTLHRYLQRMSGETNSAAVTTSLVPVELASTGERESGCGLAVVLACGRRIEMGAGFDAPTLERLIRLLEKM
jgi:transposase-like protein